MIQKSDFRNQILEIGFQKYYFRNQISDITARDVPSKQIQEPLLRANLNFLSPLPLLFFFLKISLLEMLIAFGNEHLKNDIKCGMCLFVKKRISDRDHQRGLMKAALDQR